MNQIVYEPHSSRSSWNNMFPIQWVNRSSDFMQIGPTILETKPKQHGQHALKTSMKNKENMYLTRVSDVKNDENTIFLYFEMKQDPKSSLKTFIL